MDRSSQLAKVEEENDEAEPVLIVQCVCVDNQCLNGLGELAVGPGTADVQGCCAR